MNESAFHVAYKANDYLAYVGYSKEKELGKYKNFNNVLDLKTIISITNPIYYLQTNKQNIFDILKVLSKVQRLSKCPSW